MSEDHLEQIEATSEATSEGTTESKSLKGSFKENPKKGTKAFLKLQNEGLQGEIEAHKMKEKLLVKRIKAELRMRMAIANLVVSHLELGTIYDSGEVEILKAVLSKSTNLIQE